MNKWNYSKFNTGWKMTRLEGEGIAVREMTRLEKIWLPFRKRYWGKVFWRWL